MPEDRLILVIDGARRRAVQVFPDAANEVWTRLRLETAPSRRFGSTSGPPPGESRPASAGPARDRSGTARLEQCRHRLRIWSTCNRNASSGVSSAPSIGSIIGSPNSTTAARICGCSVCRWGSARACSSGVTAASPARCKSSTACGMHQRRRVAQLLHQRLQALRISGRLVGRFLDRLGELLARRLAFADRAPSGRRTRCRARVERPPAGRDPAGRRSTWSGRRSPRRGVRGRTAIGPQTSVPSAWSDSDRGWPEPRDPSRLPNIGSAASWPPPWRRPVSRRQRDPLPRRLRTDPGPVLLRPPAGRRRTDRRGPGPPAVLPPPASRTTIAPVKPTGGDTFILVPRRSILT